MRKRTFFLSFDITIFAHIDVQFNDIFLPPLTFIRPTIRVDKYHWSCSVGSIVDNFQLAYVIKILCIIKIYC